MKKRRLVIASIVYNFIIMVFAVVYVNCTDIEIDMEGHMNAEKFYGQINQTISVMIEDNWKIMELCKESIDKDNSGVNVDELQEKLSNMNFQVGLGSSNILFINEDGNYVSLGGERGYINSEINKNLQLKKKAIVIGKIVENKNTIMFGMPVEPSQFKDFEYCTMAVVYNADYIENVLRSYDCDNTGWFIVERNGNVLYAHNYENYRIDNIITYCADMGQLDYEQITLLKDRLADYGSGTISYMKGSEKYYITYVHNPEHNWSIVGIGPRAAYIGNVDYIKILVVTIISGIFAITTIFIINMIMDRRKGTFGSKQYRENKYSIFDILAKSCDDIFIILSWDCRRVEYVSSNIWKIIGNDYESSGKNDVNLFDIKVCGKKLLDVDKIREIKEGEETKSEEKYYNVSDQQNHWYLKIIYHTEDNFKNRYVIIWSDITDEYDKNRHLQQALDIAKNANVVQRRFLAVLSHDTKTPVNAISGMAALIAKDVYNHEKVMEYAEKISQSCLHLQNLVNNFLDINKIESGKSTLNVAKFSIAKMLQDISQVVRVQVRNKKQMFIIETDNLCHNIFIGDKMRISQIIINILSNAIKYTGSKGTIKLYVCEEVMKNAAKNGSKLVFTITDNGSGMSKEYQNILFEPFSRENSSYTAGVQGTGLGMAITKSLVELMGGTIKVSSELGKGSKFTVILYLEADEVYNSLESNADLSCVTGDADNCCAVEGKRALVAEDYSINAKILAEILRMEGISADIASNGREAVKLFEASPAGYYNIILMDIQMPFMNGYDAARYIRSLSHPDAKTIPIVAMTANAFEKETMLAKEVGMDEYVTKPINIKTFRSKLHRLLEGSGET